MVLGQSGVGKSSLLNALDPSLGLAVATVSSENEKGRHTTTSARLLPLCFGGCVVDTPGIRSVALWDVIAEEVAGYFRDLRAYVSGCKFPNCTHIHEGGCAIKDAVGDGRLDSRRYESYVTCTLEMTHVIDLTRLDGVVSERAVLVAVVLDGQRSCAAPLEELEGLAETAGARVVGQITQRRPAPNATAYIGKGKVEELKSLVGDTEADVVLFDNDLAPSQTRNLEETLGVKVLDRTELILDIFASRAQTYEARLAVELAQLEYSLPRLKRMWTHLSRQKKGIGLRGPGEKQLESDRRLVERRIHDLKTEVDSIHRRRQREVATRGD